MRVFIGPDAAVYEHFKAARAASPESVLWVRLFSDGYSLLLHPVYLYFLYRWFRQSRREDLKFVLACYVAQLLVAVLLCRFVKIAVGRPRPMTGGDFDPFSLGWGYQSFPSGHTTEALGATLPLAFRFGRFALPLLLGLLVACVGYSRLYLGMHHPTDIWGGIVFGSLSGYVSWKLFTVPGDTARRFVPTWARNRSGVVRFFETVFK